MRLVQREHQRHSDAPYAPPATDKRRSGRGLFVAGVRLCDAMLRGRGAGDLW